MAFTGTLKPANAAPFRSAVLGGENIQLLSLVQKKITALAAAGGTDYRSNFSGLLTTVRQGFSQRNEDGIRAARVGLWAVVAASLGESSTATDTLSRSKTYRELSRYDLLAIDVALDALIAAAVLSAGTP